MNPLLWRAIWSWRRGGVVGAMSMILHMPSAAARGWIDERAVTLEALLAMRRLQEFEPRLVGPVLSGTATQHADVQLHLFAERPELVALWLMDQGIRHEVTARRVKMNAERVLEYPGVRFEIDDHPIEATVFPTDGIRQAPVSPVDGKPMRRADVWELEALLEMEQA